MEKSGPEGAPVFQTVETSMARPGTLVHGGLLSMLLLIAMTFGLGRPVRPHPLLFGARYPRPNVLPVDRSSIEPAEPTTEVTVRAPAEDPLRKFASLYFGAMRVLQAIDTDGDLVLSPREIAVAPTALEKLDSDHDGALNAKECGLEPRDAAESALAMRLHPTLAALDSDHSGEIGKAEIENSSKSLATLDRNGDRSLTIGELAPDEVANRSALEFSRLDRNRDGRITKDEAPLGEADRNHDGAVTQDEFTDELRRRAEIDKDLRKAVRSTFGR